jgi:hypothetical protein
MTDCNATELLVERSEEPVIQAGRGRPARTRYPLIVLPDAKSGGDMHTIELLAAPVDQHETPPRLPQLSYLRIEDEGGEWFAQVEAGQFVRDHDDPGSTTARFMAAAPLGGPGQYDRAGLLGTLHITYRARLLARVGPNGGPVSVDVRPFPMAGVEPAGALFIARMLNLPTEGYRIGDLATARAADGTAMALVLDAYRLRHHICIAGATGSGKSNTTAEVIGASQELGRTTFVYDHKPDYVNEIHHPNPAVDIQEQRGLLGVRYYTIGDNPNEGQLISVPAMELDTDLLARTICFRPSEENQAEVLEQILRGYQQNQNQVTQNWTIWSFIDWLKDRPEPQAVASAMPFPMEIHKQTYSALRSRLTRRDRIPDWIDRMQTQRRLPFGDQPSQPSILPNAVDEMLRDALVDESGRVIRTLSTQEQRNPGAVSDPGARVLPAINVVRIPSTAMGSRSYALFLSYLLARTSEHRQNAPRARGITHLIDEAADVFAGAGRDKTREAAVVMLNENIRKGRSLNIAFVIALQSAGDVPEAIRHNLNTNIVFRHRHPEVLKAILPSSSKETLARTDSLGPGEALVDLFGVTGLMLCRMRRARCRLRTD